MLGYAPALGRDFVPAEDMPGGPNVAIISHAMWRTHFGSAADMAGRAIRLNGEPVTVVGVLPEPFAFPYEDEPVEVIVPLRLTVDPSDVAEDWPAIARLRDGVTREQAQSEIASLTGPFRAAYPNQVSEQDRGMTLATFSELYVNANVRRALWFLMGAVTLVLLIACANVANLFLARASRRRGEIALRIALGATRERIARLVLTESVLVALAAGDARPADGEVGDRRARRAHAGGAAATDGRRPRRAGAPVHIRRLARHERPVRRRGGMARGSGSNLGGAEGASPGQLGPEPAPPGPSRSRSRRSR